MALSIMQSMFSRVSQQAAEFIQSLKISSHHFAYAEDARKAKKMIKKEFFRCHDVKANRIKESAT
jgi:hypothetical protein